MKREADGTTTWFDLDRDSEISVAWYINMPLNTGNVMAMVFRDGPTSPWRGLVRTRVYVDDKMGVESKDRRRGMETVSTPDEAGRVEIVSRLDMAFEMMKKAFGQGFYRLERTGPAGPFLEEWSKMPFVHVSVEERQ